MALLQVQGGWVNTSTLFVNGNHGKIQTPLSNAYIDWKSNWPGTGPKYVWFEHHTEMVFGIKCDIDYHSRIVSNIEIVDGEKFMLFMLKYS